MSIDTVKIADQFIELVTDEYTSIPIGYENQPAEFDIDDDVVLMVDSSIIDQTDVANTVEGTLFNLNFSVDIVKGIGVKKQNDLLVGIQDIINSQDTSNINVAIDGMECSVINTSIFTDGELENGRYRKTLNVIIKVTK